MDTEPCASYSRSVKVTRGVCCPSDNEPLLVSDTERSILVFAVAGERAESIVRMLTDWLPT